MGHNLQERKLILLEDDTDQSIRVLKDTLRSPLGLAKALVCLSFTQDPTRGLLGVREKLDSIKRMAAGLASAEAKSNYKVANYAVYLFAFQQFFHSSYRARQGNVLEAVIRTILKDLGVDAYDKSDHKSVLEHRLGILTTSSHDLDIIAWNRSDYLLVQIRSRDDTGGTTAKGSLVELLRDILREKIRVSSPIRYVVYVWETLQENQKQSLINKILGELHGQVRSEDLGERMGRGEPTSIQEKIELQLAYGPEQFSEILLQFTKNPRLRDVFRETIQFASGWDDLWLSYAIASLELERLTIGNKSNFEILKEKLQSENIVLAREDLSRYLEISETYALQLLPKWTDPTLPVSAPADQLTYIRDLILLKMVHHKIHRECHSITDRFRKED